MEEDYNKCIKVINSCKNLDQLEFGENYLYLFSKKYYEIPYHFIADYVFYLKCLLLDKKIELNKKNYK